jgi:hypothetical protein
VALVLLDVLCMLAFSMINVGLHGRFNYHALPASLLFVPLVLLLGVVAARAARDRTLLLALPVALLASGVMVTVAGEMLGALMQHKLMVLPARHWK